MSLSSALNHIRARLFVAALGASFKSRPQASTLRRSRDLADRLDHRRQSEIRGGGQASTRYGSDLLCLPD
jgi:hypothetical protein